MGSDPSKRILIVRHDVDGGSDVARLLGDMDITVVDGCDGALRQAREIWFDCYVVQCALHDGALETFCRGMRTLDPAVPIVAYGDGDGGRDGHHALVVGANLFLSRPADAPRLRSAIETMFVLRERRVRQAREAERLAVVEARLDAMDAASTGADEAVQRQENWLAQSRRFADDQRTQLVACKAFLNAGGTRAAFERAWPQFKSELLDSLPRA